MLRLYFWSLLLTFNTLFLNAQTKFVVDRLTDNNTIAGEGFGNSGDLRYCISMAGFNTTSEINFDVDGEIVISNSLPGISNELLIDAKDKNIAINGQSLFRVFTVLNTGKLSINRVNVFSGYAEYGSDGGGAVLNYGQLEIDSCNFGYNISDADGGAISITSGTFASISNSYLFYNVSNGFGGAIYNIQGSITVTGCIFERDSSSTAYGAIADFGNSFIKNSQFLMNSASTGASAYGVADLSASHQIENCVFYENGSYAKPELPSIRNTALLTCIHTSLFSSIGSGITSETENGDPYQLDLINSIVAISGFNNSSLMGTISGSSFNNIVCGFGINNVEEGVNGNINSITEADSIFRIPYEDYYALGLNLAPYSKAIDTGLQSLAGFNLPNRDLKDSLRGDKFDIGAIEFQKLNPNISFNQESEIVYTSELIPINATVDFGLNIRFEAEGPAAVFGNANLSLTGVGIVTLTGSIDENRYFNSTKVSVFVTVIKAPQSISGLDQFSDLTFSGNSFTITLPGLSTAGLEINYQLETDPPVGVASVLGNFLTIYGDGNITLNASQAGNEMYDSTFASLSFMANRIIDTTTGFYFQNYGAKNPIIIYPNPSNGWIYIKSPDEGNVFIFNSLGQLVHSILSSKDQMIYLGNKGLYLMKFKNEKGEWTKKILVE